MAASDPSLDANAVAIHGYLNYPIERDSKGYYITICNHRYPLHYWMPNSDAHMEPVTVCLYKGLWFGVGPDPEIAKLKSDLSIAAHASAEYLQVNHQLSREVIDLRNQLNYLKYDKHVSRNGAVAESPASPSSPVSGTSPSDIDGPLSSPGSNGDLSVRFAAELDGSADATSPRPNFGFDSPPVSPDSSRYPTLGDGTPEAPRKNRKRAGSDLKQGNNSALNGSHRSSSAPRSTLRQDLQVRRLSNDDQIRLNRWLKKMGFTMPDEAEPRPPHRRPVHLAAERDEWEVLTLLYNIGISMDSVDDSGWSPLHVAAYAGHLRTVMWLVAAPQDPSSSLTISKPRCKADIQAFNGFTATSLAALMGYLHIAGHLNNIVEVKDDEAALLFKAAVHFNRPETVTWIKTCLGHDLKSRFGDQGVLYAVQGYHHSMLRRLLELGCRTSGRDHNGATPLMLAVRCGYYDLVDLLLQSPHDPDDMDNAQRKVFAYAKMSPEPAKMEAHLHQRFKESPPSVRQRIDRATSLAHISPNDMSLKDWLKRNGFGSSASTYFPTSGAPISPILKAASECNLAIFCYIQAESDFTKDSNLYWNVLYKLVERRNGLAILQWLSERGFLSPTFPAPPFNAPTLASCAVHSGQYQIFKWLLKHGFPFKGQDDTGEEMVRVAVRFENFSMVSELISPRLRCIVNIGALTDAIQARSLPIFSLLLANFHHQTLYDDALYNTLHKAATDAHSVEIVAFLESQTYSRLQQATSSNTGKKTKKGAVPNVKRPA